uniref:Uncharacterized protein n=1 Tax=Caenorhabditis japonica TaxID=281687 RepID=A0A8R1I1N4_CAEJA
MKTIISRLQLHIWPRCRRENVRKVPTTPYCSCPSSRPRVFFINKKLVTLFSPYYMYCIVYCTCIVTDWNMLVSPTMVCSLKGKYKQQATTNGRKETED